MSILLSTETALEKQMRDEKNREWLTDNMKRFIRQRFDQTLLSTEAESWIAIAKENGFTEMVEEMESDLQSELLTA